MEPPSWRSPAGGVSPAPGVSPPPSSSLHAAKATTATAAIAAGRHNQRDVWGGSMALVAGELPLGATSWPGLSQAWVAGRADHSPPISAGSPIATVYFQASVCYGGGTG